jgi:hypothetical protein
MEYTRRGHLLSVDQQPHVPDKVHRQQLFAKHIPGVQTGNACVKKLTHSS